MILNDFPQIMDHTWFIQQSFFRHNEELLGYSGDLHMAQYDDNEETVVFKETKVIIAARNLFEFFTIPLVHGNKHEVLREPNTVVLSQDAALRYFGKANPIGRSLVVNGSKAVTVTGVFKSLLPDRTHLDFDLVFSGTNLKPKLDEAMEYRPWMQSYVKLGASDSAEKLQASINRNMEKYWGLYFEFYGRAKAEVVLQPVTEVAFLPYSWGDPSKPKSRLILNAMKLVAVLIIVMACINYVNLSNSRMVKRNKEIVARKMAGAKEGNFFLQFFTEALVVNLISILAAFTAIQLIRAPLSSFLRIHVSDFGSTQLTTWSAMAIASFSSLLIAASYPAYWSFRHNPRSILVRVPGASLRSLSSWFATAQFTGACVLTVFGFVVYMQLRFLVSKDLGFDKSRVVILEVPEQEPSSPRGDVQALVAGIRTHLEAVYSHSLPGDIRQGEVRLWRKGEFFGAVAPGGVDESFLPFFGIKLLAGRNFIANDRNDVCIVSRRSIQRLGFPDPESSLGSRIGVDDGRNEAFGGTRIEMEIIGVIEDFIVDPSYVFSNALLSEGTCLTAGSNGFHHLAPTRIAVRMNGEDFEGSLAIIRKQFLRVFPRSAMEWYFIDDHFNQGYDNERTTRNQVGLFTALAIGISCLGMLGMISHKAERRTKELGIRKVLGASPMNLAHVLLQGSVRHFLTAVLMAIPIAYFVSRIYLTRYAERIEIEYWYLLLPVFFLTLILISTIAVVIIRAARSNPVEALKYE